MCSLIEGMTPVMNQLIFDYTLPAGVLVTYQRLAALAWRRQQAQLVLEDFNAELLPLLGLSRTQARHHLRLLRMVKLLHWDVAADGCMTIGFPGLIPSAPGIESGNADSDDVVYTALDKIESIQHQQTQAGKTPQRADAAEPAGLAGLVRLAEGLVPASEGGPSQPLQGAQACVPAASGQVKGRPAVVSKAAGALSVSSGSVPPWQDAGQGANPSGAATPPVPPGQARGGLGAVPESLSGPPAVAGRAPAWQDAAPGANQSGAANPPVPPGQVRRGLGAVAESSSGSPAAAGRAPAGQGAVPGANQSGAATLPVPAGQVGESLKTVPSSIGAGAGGKHVPSGEAHTAHSRPGVDPRIGELETLMDDPLFSDVMGWLARLGIWTDHAIRLARQIRSNELRDKDYLPTRADVLGWIAYCYAFKTDNNIRKPAQVVAANLSNNRRCPEGLRPPRICLHCNREEGYCLCHTEPSYGFPKKFFEFAMNAEYDQVVQTFWAVCLTCHAFPCQCEASI